jgi:asparagine synthase (glutamine-hydrolysing)
MSLNAFCVVWNLDERPVDPSVLARCAFQSPHWTPDHQAAWIQGPLGFTCTQRAITPEDARERMPHVDPESGCVLAADSRLIRRDALAADLGVDAALPDCELLLAAYLKWGDACVRRLSGDFSFVLWDPRAKRMFAATDRLGHHGFYYTHVPGKLFACANTMAPLRLLRPRLPLNRDLPPRLALDSTLPGQTCHREILKSHSASTYRVDASGVAPGARYWKLGDAPPALRGKTREAHHEAFRQVFDEVVREHLRTPYPVLAHISGGLDSTAVACVAAAQAARTGRTLLGFTAIPFALEGPGYRGNWHYHEMDLVQDVLDQYPNIEHTVFRTDPEADILGDLDPLLAFSDLPFRNTANLHWITGSLRRVAAAGGRTVLTGGAGNGSISWRGRSPRDFASLLYHGAKNWLAPGSLFNGYFKNHNPVFLKSPLARATLRHRGVLVDPQAWMLSQAHGAPAFPSLRTLSLWHGVTVLDPTGEAGLAEFCRALPQSAFMRGQGRRQRRLLVREGMAGIVPESVRRNERRGEQAADWYLQYNRHAAAWKTRLENIAPGAAAVLWGLYDRERILALFERHPSIPAPKMDTFQEVGLVLIRCLSLAFFLDYLERRKA